MEHPLKSCGTKTATPPMLMSRACSTSRKPLPMMWTSMVVPGAGRTLGCSRCLPGSATLSSYHVVVGLLYGRAGARYSAGHDAKSLVSARRLGTRRLGRRMLARGSSSCRTDRAHLDDPDRRNARNRDARHHRGARSEPDHLRTDEPLARTRLAG